MTQRFPARERLKRRNDFAEVLTRGRRGATEGLVYWFKENGLSFSRIGIRIGRSVGGAVYRNRIKRILREIYRRNKNLFSRKGDLVLKPRQGIADDYHKLEDEFKKISASISSC